METLLEAQRATYADLLSLDVDEHTLYELIAGELVQRSSPSPQHQLVSIKLSSLLHVFVSTSELGTILCAPIDVRLDEHNVLQPDIMFITKEREHFITSIGVMGSPNLVVEIISPTTARRDRKDKFMVYQTFGVAENWLIDPANHVVELFRIIDGAYSFVSVGTDVDVVQSEVVRGFSLAVETIF
jgi:Uma2 family endonuclease